MKENKNMKRILCLLALLSIFLALPVFADELTSPTTRFLTFGGGFGDKGFGYVAL
jgi:hypothetical protein